MTARDDKEIVKGWFDRRNWGCCTVALVGLAVAATGLLVASAEVAAFYVGAGQ